MVTLLSTLKLERFGVLRKWVGECMMNFRPGQNPDRRVIDPEGHAEECLSRSKK